MNLSLPTHRVASRANHVWAATPVRHRGRVLRRFRRLLACHAEPLAAAVRAPIAEVLIAQVLPLAEACRFLERRAARILAPRREGNIEIRREPHGVVLVIGPSNYPLFLPAVQSLQALAAGNAVLIKPGSGGHAAATGFARLLYAAGLDPSLCVVLDESPQAARDAILGGVDKIVFTGNDANGQLIYELATQNLTPVTMELSGDDPVIVRADADIALTRRALAFGLKFNNGHTCIAPKRLIVHRAVAGHFETDALPPLRPHGAGQSWNKPPIHSALQSGWSGGGPDENPNRSLLRRLVVDSDDEAVRRANESAYALGATIFSRDIRAAQAMAGRLNAGVVVINDMIAPTADARAPFGGRARSGFGVTRGTEGLLEMTRLKTVITQRRRWRPHLDGACASDAPMFSAWIELKHAAGPGNKLRALARLISITSTNKRRIRS